MLQNFGKNSDYAINGKNAIETIREKQADKSCSCTYEIVFMDCNMPLMNGFVATEKLKKLFGAYVLTPMSIIACTAGVTRSEIDRCKKAGYDDILAKPMTGTSVKEMLKKYTTFNIT